MDWIHSWVQKAWKALVLGAGAGIGLWLVALIANALSAKIGLSGVVFGMPSGWEWVLDPFKMSTVVAAINLVCSTAVCCCKKEEKKE